MTFDALATPRNAYLLTISVIGLVVLLLIRFWLRREEERRKEQIEQLRRFVAIKEPPTDTGKAVKHARTRAIESEATRFAMIKRITFPLLLMIWVLLIGVPFLPGIPATVVSLVIAALTVVLGIAAKPVLENLVAGIMLAFGQPIRIGDLVLIEGHYGLVEEINVTHTVIKVWDWRRFVVPNSRLLQMEYLNYSLNDRWYWACVQFWIAYDADIQLVEKLALEAMEQADVRADDTAAGFWIMEMRRDAVLCWVAGWVENGLDGWTLKNQVATTLLISLQQNGIKAHLNYHEGKPMPLTPQPDDSFQSTAPPTS